MRSSDQITPETVRPFIDRGDESVVVAPVEEEEDEDVLDEGAVRGPKRIHDIRTPTRAEVDRRNLTHLPFRNWRPHCVRGRGKEAPHRAVKEGKGELPEISLDLFPESGRRKWGTNHSGCKGASFQNDTFAGVSQQEYRHFCCKPGMGIHEGNRMQEWGPDIKK